MSKQDIIKLSCQFIITYTLVCGAILGAYLGGAEPSAWTFALGAYASVMLVVAVNLFGVAK